jgi:cytochrome c-type biogenesis protein CcmE
VKPKRKRLWLLLGSMAALALAVTLALTALDDNLVFFHSPTQIVEKKPPTDKRLRVGGLVQPGSVMKGSDGLTTTFTITDMRADLKVSYRGQLPDLFREGQGVVAEGTLGTDGVFIAREILAKHDETYMPPEVAKALKDSGHWKQDARK